MLFKSTVNVERSRILQWAFIAAHGISILLIFVLTRLQLVFPLLIIIVGSISSLVVLSIKPGAPKEIQKLTAYIITVLGYAMLIREINLGNVDISFLDIDNFLLILLGIISVIFYIGWTSSRENVINAFDLLVEPGGIGIIFANDNTKRFFYPLSSIIAVRIKDIRTANFSLSKNLILTVKQQEDTARTISLNLAYVDKDLRRQEGICYQVVKDVGLGERPS